MRNELNINISDIDISIGVSYEGTVEVKNMLCCLGLFAGFYVGSMLGGPWTVIAPVLGFGLGLFGDRRLMRGYGFDQIKNELQTGRVDLTQKIESDEDAESLEENPLVSGR